MNTVEQSMSPTERGNNGWRWMLLSALVVIADQVSKNYIVGHFEEFEVKTLLPVLDITLVHNVGAAFSFLASASGWQRWFFIVLACGVSIGIGAWLVRLPANARKLTAAGLALVMGGAIGNVIDRFRLGSVVDFIHFHWDRAYFPAFNVADSAITVGAAFLLLDALLDSKRSS
jgi:signal peptidase II